jgi:membrane protein
MALFNFEAIYGTFAAVPLFLLWIYVVWTIVLLGAEFVKSIGVYRFDGAHEVEEPLFQMIVLLEQLYLAHQNGEMVTEKDIRRQSHRIDLEQWAEMRSRLLELRLIRAVDNGGLVLSKDLSEVSVWDLYSRYPWQLPRQLKGEKAWEKKLFGQFTVLNEGNRTALDIDLESLFKEAK